jgi:transcriptional regulator with XRE-family HTH domain
MAQGVFFSQNLRRLVDSRGGVLSVAKAVGINRTQLHRYVNGDALPRPKLIAKLADHFAVSETTLFERTIGYGLSKEVPDLTEHPFFQQTLQNLSDASPVSIRPGRYLTYFYTPSDEGMVVRAITFVSKLGKQAQFVRLTGTKEPQNSRWRISRGRNIGVVMESRGNVFFLGFERGPVRQPSLLVMRLAQTGRDLLAGHGVVTARLGPALTGVVMERVSETLSMTETMRLCSTISLRDRALDSDIRILLQEQAPN